MIGVCGGATPCPEEEAVFLSCRRVIAVNGHHPLSVKSIPIENFDTRVLMQCVKPFTGLTAICYALKKWKTEPIFCGYMDLYYEVCKLDNKKHIAHDRALHARLYLVLKRAHGERLIYAPRFMDAIERLSKIPTNQVHIRGITNGVPKKEREKAKGDRSGVR